MLKWETKDYPLSGARLHTCY